jgi:hypothetical protein
MTFRVGQRVVCVDADKFSNIAGVFASGNRPDLDADWLLQEGEIYTVESIVVHPLIDTAVMRLVEIPERVSVSMYGDLGYAVSRFRPLISQADDIAMFRKMVEGMKPTERLDRLAELLDTTPS